MASQKKASKAVKLAAPAIISKSTSSAARTKLWDLMIDKKTSGLSKAQLAERVGLKPSAINFAYKYFRQITAHLKANGLMKA